MCLKKFFDAVWGQASDPTPRRSYLLSSQDVDYNMRLYAWGCQAEGVGALRAAVLRFEHARIDTGMGRRLLLLSPQGVSLVETMVALVVIVVGLSAFMGLVQWDISPALELEAALAATAQVEDKTASSRSER